MMQETTEIEFLRKSAMNEDEYVFNVFYDFMYKPQLSLMKFKDFVLNYFAESKRNIILDSINQIIIIKVSINNHNRKDSLAKAIYTLHHEHQLGLKYISGILKINEIDISTNDLMVYSQQHFEKTPLPTWTKNILNNNPIKDWGKIRLLTSEENHKARHNSHQQKKRNRERAKKIYETMTPEQKRERYLKYTKPYLQKNRESINARLRQITRIKNCFKLDLEQLLIKTQNAYNIRLGWGG